MAALEFDVFLSHKGSDKPKVRELKRLLTAAGTKAWLDEEMQGALQLAVDDKRPIIPTLLPGCPRRPADLPLFLGNRT